MVFSSFLVYVGGGYFDIKKGNQNFFHVFREDRDQNFFTFAKGAGFYLMRDQEKLPIAPLSVRIIIALLQLSVVYIVVIIAICPS